MFCTFCGSENPNNARYCVNCGHEINNPLIRSSTSTDDEKTRLCPFCKKEISIEALKCKYCGEWVNKEKKGRKKILKLIKTAVITETISQIFKTIRGASAAKIAPTHLALMGLGTIAVTTLIVGAILVPTNSSLDNNTTQIDTQQAQVNNSPQSNYISVSKAKSIANQYLASQGSYLRAGATSLRGSVYYVEERETRDEAQAPKGTCLDMLWSMLKPVRY